MQVAMAPGALRDWPGQERQTPKHQLYAWGTMGNFPGALWGVHGMSVDSEGNLYLAEVDNGRVEKFTPKPGANPAFLVAKPTKPVYTSSN